MRSGHPRGKKTGLVGEEKRERRGRQKRGESRGEVTMDFLGDGRRHTVQTLAFGAYNFCSDTKMVQIIYFCLITGINYKLHTDLTAC